MTDVYLDASAFIPLFVQDHFSDQSRALIMGVTTAVVISDWTVAEAASSFARSVRMGTLSRENAALAHATIDGWALEVGERLEVKPSDIRAADGFLRRLDTSLRTPDALHIAIAKRAGLALVTFDDVMARDAQRLGLEVFAT